MYQWITVRNSQYNIFWVCLKLTRHPVYFWNCEAENDKVHNLKIMTKLLMRIISKQLTHTSSYKCKKKMQVAKSSYSRVRRKSPILDRVSCVPILLIQYLLSLCTPCDDEHWFCFFYWPLTVTINQTIRLLKMPIALRSRAIDEIACKTYVRLLPHSAQFLNPAFLGDVLGHCLLILPLYIEEGLGSSLVLWYSSLCPF